MKNLMMIITLTILLIGVLQAAPISECELQYQGECSESLCWDYDAEAGEKDQECFVIAEQICSKKITEYRFNEAVKKLATIQKECTGLYGCK